MDYMSDPFTEIFDEWENTTVATFTNTSDDGHRHAIQYSVELLEMYRQYTMK
jgi:nitrate reductase assembly molybdenum cofactor insertion protein NarJ